ncbi:MAG: thioesterase family protein [Candidatus Nanopelagicales bacterium]
MAASERPPHEISLKVRGYHLDLYGHVNNARYLEFLEEARWAMIEERTDLPRVLAEGPAMVVVHLSIDYRYPASIGDELVIATRIGQIGRKSAVIHQEIRLAGPGTAVAEADLTLVFVDKATGRAVPIDGELREFLAGLD